MVTHKKPASSKLSNGSCKNEVRLFESKKRGQSKEIFSLPLSLSQSPSLSLNLPPSRSHPHPTNCGSDPGVAALESVPVSPWRPILQCDNLGAALKTTGVGPRFDGGGGSWSPLILLPGDQGDNARQGCGPDGD